jgi:UDP-N-acetylglucosamine 1-carboxyvinyltransferase
MLCDPQRAVVMGHDFKSQLKATTMSSPDIRAGISLLIAFCKRDKYHTKH